MRKWMRERLQRRKKKTSETPEPAPPPLQPAYFEAGQPESVSEPDSSEPEVPQVVPSGEAEPETAAPDGEDSSDATGSRRQPARGRRRRGGRGRGGRGREQAVAQAFAPKGAISTPATEPESTPIENEEQPPDSEFPEAAAQPAPSRASAAAIPAAPQRPPKGIVVLAIGLPGSGKSSWFKRHNVVPLSSDLLRSLLFDDVREQRYQDLVFSNLRSMLKARLIAKRPMNYVDATNLTPAERQHWIKLAKDYNYEVHAVFFDVPLEVCIERHQRRDRVIPEDVMRRMSAKLKPPAFEEGFAKITVVRVKKKEPAAEA
ncbi:MAG TPA: AAA family ATPase [Candidatus Binatia bacterium]|nr:AAA family ATPase [Candidatus Binatia bacterium]